MPEREDVIEGLEHCIRLYAHSVCVDKDCPYYRVPMNCDHVLMQQAIDVIMDYENRIKTLEEKLRMLEHGDQDAMQSGLMPAT